jgi:hypothetical protein
MCVAERSPSLSDLRRETPPKGECVLVLDRALQRATEASEDSVRTPCHDERNWRWRKASRPRSRGVVETDGPAAARGRYQGWRFG